MKPGKKSGERVCFVSIHISSLVLEDPLAAQDHIGLRLTLSMFPELLFLLLDPICGVLSCDHTLYHVCALLDAIVDPESSVGRVLLIVNSLRVSYGVGFNASSTRVVHRRCRQ